MGSNVVCVVLVVLVVSVVLTLLRIISNTFRHFAIACERRTIKQTPRRKVLYIVIGVTAIQKYTHFAISQTSVTSRCGPEGRYNIISLRLAF